MLETMDRQGVSIDYGSMGGNGVVLFVLHDIIVFVVFGVFVVSPVKHGRQIGIMIPVAASLSALSHLWFPIDNS